jgi:hypothetical protein
VLCPVIHCFIVNFLLRKTGGCPVGINSIKILIWKSSCWLSDLKESGSLLEEMQIHFRLEFRTSKV